MSFERSPGSRFSTPADDGVGTERSNSAVTIEEVWDAYDLEALLALKDAYAEPTELGYLIRHYWLPPTVLLYLQTSMSTYADGTSEQSSCVIERTMARCRSNECLWREKTWPVESLDRWDSYAERAPLSELMCEYRSHDQTFRMSRPTSRNPPEPVDAAEARREALYRLPFLAPPAGPMTVGFEWRGEAGEDHMNFRLEAEKRVKETSVLVIRREGRYTTWLPSGPESADAGSTRVPVVVHRRGLTLFAWKRGAVLEDRSLDCVLDPGARRPDGGGAGSTHRVLRLLSSRPVND